MIDSLVRHVYYPLLDRVKKAQFGAALRQAVDHQRASKDELTAIATGKLRAILAHAETHCPYYRARFADHGVGSNDLRAPHDLARFPLLTKDDVFEARDRMLSPVYVGRRFYAATSGSTGIALSFCQDSLQYAWVEAAQWRGRQWWGVRRGDALVSLWGRPLKGGRVVGLQAWMKHRLRNSLHFNVFGAFDDRLVRRIHEGIRRVRPKLIYGYGSSIGRLADGMARLGLRLGPEERPVVIEYTADHMYRQERELAADVLGAPVTSAYGASECAGVAQECPAGNLHVSVDHVAIEFLRHDGTPADPDEEAEIVLTTLHNRAMPIIRYRVGDTGSYSSKECSCGITLPLMSFGLGKTVDLVTTSFVHNASAHVLDYINIHVVNLGLKGIKQFLAEHTGLDSFILSIVRQEPYDPRSVEVFVDKMKEHLGAGIEVTVRFTNEIPPEPSGKRKYYRRSFAQADNRRES